MFIILQLANNLRQDIAISPIYAYGMYSEVIAPQHNYTVMEISTDNKLLKAKNFSPQAWDKIMLPVRMYYTQKTWNNNLWKKDISRLIHTKDSTAYINTLSENEFKIWYKKYLEKILGHEIYKINIQYEHYAFTGAQLIKTNVDTIPEF